MGCQHNQAIAIEYPRATHGVHALAGRLHFPIALCAGRLTKKLVGLRLPDWSVRASRGRIRLGDIHFQYPPEEFRPIHVVYRIGRVASVVVLQKRKPLVLLCGARGGGGGGSNPSLPVTDAL